MSDGDSGAGSSADWEACVSSIIVFASDIR